MDEICPIDILDPEEALKPGAPLIPPPETSKSNLREGGDRTFTLHKGDVEKGFKAADRKLEDIYRTNFIHYAYIEPRSCLVQWNGENLILQGPTQTPHVLRSMAARVLGIPESSVRVISPYIGGSFGSKNYGRDFLIAALLAKKTNRPVMMRLSREECVLTKIRHACTMHIKMGVKNDGTFTAIHGKFTTASGGYLWSFNSDACRPIHCLFRTPNARTDSRAIYTNHPYTGQMRSVANGPMSFAVCSLVDKVAEDLELDPVEFVRRTHIQAGDDCTFLWNRPGTVLSSCGLDECLEKGAEAIGWARKWKGHKTPVEVRGTKRIGIGMAPMTHACGEPTYVSSAIVRINMDGTAEFGANITEHGQGGYTTQAQILAEASGIPFENIRVIGIDTLVTPIFLAGSVGSSGTHVSGLATKLAGEDVRKQLLERAAEELEVSPQDLDIDNGRIYIKDNPEKTITMRELMAKTVTGVMPIIGRGVVRKPNWPQEARDFGAHFAEVEVDTETGEVKVLKYIAAHDVGRAINPLVVEGQIEGGVVMGVGWALSEQLRFDESGRPLNPNLTDYKILTAADIPEIVPIIVESNDPLGPFGAKGFGEAPYVPVHACIANAIYNAIGIRFKELPIIPDKVIKAIKAGVKEYPA